MLNNLLLYYHLIKEFMKIGIFSFGGGYATLPFLFDIGAQCAEETQQRLP